MLLEVAKGCLKLPPAIAFFFDDGHFSNFTSTPRIESITEISM